ncbi:MAG: PD-(D/E)XK nuclease family protein, partial [Candidatus Eremiobacterota bacterium]
GLPDLQGEPMDCADPVPLELASGQVLLLRGRVDRVDRLANGSYEVVDYKTGARPPHKKGSVFAQGRQLQHALYAEVIEQVLPGAVVSGGSYYFPSRRAQNERLHIPRPARAELEAVLGDLLEILDRGAFVHTPDADTCRFCDFRAVCGTSVIAQARRKLEVEEEERLAAFRRLRDRR